MALVECVPNISEGRRADVVSRCATAVSRNAAVLDVSSDPSHNRSVLTVAGEPRSLERAVIDLFDAAVQAIDLRSHEGEHPRIGAVDVVPFIPLADATMDECAGLARTVGEAVASLFGIPVYLYERASGPGRVRHLEEIRRGGLAALAARMTTPEWAPDFGPRTPHVTAGVAVVGARPFLIAYNVELSTDRLAIAQTIARSVRQSSGGLPAVKAIAVPLAERGTVQVSMNLTDFQTTSIAQAFDAVATEARRHGVEVEASELVGLAPAAALNAEIARHVRLHGFDADRMILERRLAANLPPR